MRIAMPENATKLANDALTYRPLEPLGKKAQFSWALPLGPLNGWRRVENITIIMSSNERVRSANLYLVTEARPLTQDLRCFREVLILRCRLYRRLFLRPWAHFAILLRFF